PAGRKDPGVHLAQIARNARPKAHLRDHVALDVDARRDLDQLEAVGPDAKDRTLGDEQRNLALCAADVGAVADLLELLHELPVSPFPADHRSAAFPADVEVAGGQRAAEHDTLRVLADVDEAADADDPV